MASPRSPYAQSVPGPSTFYPSPSPNPYAYMPPPVQYPHPQHYPQPPPIHTHSPRMSGRGGLSYSPTRGGNPYHQNQIPHMAAYSPTDSKSSYPHSPSQKYATPPFYAYQQPPGPYWSQNPPQNMSPIPNQQHAEPSHYSSTTMPSGSEPPSVPESISGSNSAHGAAPEAISQTHSQKSQSGASSPSGRRQKTKEIPPAWVIWKHRPDDPSLAPGIIFSRRSKPPPNVVAKALEIPSPQFTRSVPLPAVEDAVVPAAAASEVPPPAEFTIPSSSEISEVSTVPASPSSSNTSLSAAGPQGQETVKTPQLVSVPESAAETPATPTRETSEQIVAPSEDSGAFPDLPAVSSAPAPEPPSAPIPPVKKSWASLLKPAGSAAIPESTAASGSTRNALPRSTVVGISVPAVEPGAQSVPEQLVISPAKKAELISLLNMTGSSSTLASPAPSTSMKVRPRGLINTGNMCFANSVLQVLLYCPPFYRLFAALGRLFKGEKQDERTTPLVDATIQFFEEFVQEDTANKGQEKAKMTLRDSMVRNGKGKEREILDGELEDEEDLHNSFIPTYVYDAMKEKKRFEHMRGGQQEDAEEFFGFFLDTLEEELLSIVNALSPQRPNGPDVEEKEEAEAPEDDGWMEVGKRNRMVVTRVIKSTESPITKTFGGKFRSTLKMPQQKDSVTLEDWRSLRLDIQRDGVHTIQDALSLISQPQTIQMSHPSKAGVTVDASQQVLIDSLPPVLVLHLKRFCYDVSVGGVVKVGKHVRFSPELEISHDILSATMRRGPLPKYKLFGAVYHHGMSASGGHYTLDVLHPNRYPGAKNSQGWIRIDDELFSDVRPDDVFDQERDDGGSRSAYLLFYLRIR